MESVPDGNGTGWKGGLCCPDTGEWEGELVAAASEFVAKGQRWQEAGDCASPFTEAPERAPALLRNLSLSG